MTPDGPAPRDASPDPAEELAARIADGRSVDWPAGGGGEQTPGQPDPATLAQLKAIADIADLHRLPTDPGADDDPEQAWGPLTIISRIGEGAFGEVFRAWDTKLHRQVALKLFRTIDSGNVSQPNGAILEARRLARVRHPNVLVVYGAEQRAGQTGIWTELVEGETLHAIVARDGPLPVADAIAIGVDLSRALGAVHGAGLLHRDVKAQNIMREVGGRIVLMDFGAGMDAATASDQQVDFSGTPLYLAPELYQGAAPSAATDVYALAVVLFHLLTGSYPVTGLTLDEVRANHRAGLRRRLSEIAPGVSLALAAVIDRSLEADPDKRYPSASDFERALVAASFQNRYALRTRSGARVLRRVALGLSAVSIAVLLVLWTTGYLLPAASSSPELVCTDCLGRERRSRGTALSRDGRILVMADEISGDLLIRDLDTGKTWARGLPGLMPRVSSSVDRPGFPLNPVFSGDSSRVAFMWRANSVVGSLQVWSIGTTQGLPMRMDPSNTVPAALYGLTADGSAVLAAVVKYHPSSDIPTSQLVWMSPKGTALVKAPWSWVKQIDESRWSQQLPDSWSLSADGRLLAYAASPRGSEDDASGIRHIYLLRTDTTGRETIPVQTAARNLNPAWNADGNRLYFTSDVSNDVDLWSVAVRDGQAAGPHTLEVPGIGEVRSLILPAERGAYFTRPFTRQDFIYITFLPPKGMTVSHPWMQQVVPGFRPKWSDDGAILRFRRHARPERGLSGQVMTLDIKSNGERLEALEDLTIGYQMFPPAKSPSEKTANDWWAAIETVPVAEVYGASAPKNGYYADDEGTDIEFVRGTSSTSLLVFRSDSTKAVRVSAVLSLDTITGKVTPLCVLPNRPPGLSERESVGLALSWDRKALAIALSSKGHASVGVLHLDTCRYQKVYGPYRTQGTHDRVAWAPDNQAVLVSEETGGPTSPRYQILRVSWAGGQTEPVLFLNGTDRDSSFDVNSQGLLAFHINPAFPQVFAPNGRSELDFWRIQLKKHY